MCVTDMGCDINLDCASSALKKCATDCVIVVNADPVHWQFGSFIRELAHRTSVPIVVSGRAAGEEWQQDNEHVIVLDTVEDTIRFVSRLRENIRSHMS